MKCAKCVGITVLGKKKTFIVMGDTLQDIAIKADNYSYKGTTLKEIERVLSIEILGDTENNTLVL